MQTNVLVATLLLGIGRVFYGQDNLAIEKVALCDVMKTPASFAGHRVSLQGIVMGEHTDRLLIMWPECQFGMKLVLSKDVESHADVQDMYRAVRKGNPGTVGHDITRRFTGLFHYSEAGSLYELQIEKVEPSEPYHWPKD